LCVAPCPTDCIELVPVKTTTANWKWDLNTIPVQNISVEPNEQLVTKARGETHA
ncbi:electron transport complex subunit RsxB, partial [Escherichia coli]|nr:electron transport complex subunit RsxB [Escherichia coli]